MESKEIITEFIQVMREADLAFEKTGGGTRHYVNDCLLPLMEQKGLTISLKAQPGAVWVKASEFKTHKSIFRPYRVRCSEDEGEYDYGEMRITEDDGRIYLDVDNECNFEHQSDERWADYEILDESPAGREDAAEFAEWAGWDWRRVEGKSMWENQKTLEVISTSKLYEKYKEETR